MLEHIEQCQSLLKAKTEVIKSAQELPGDCPDVLTTLSNTDLLLNELVKFYKNKKSKFFPRAISNSIELTVKEVVAILTSLPDSGEAQPDQVSEAVVKMDKLYGDCLKFGLVTFGFSAKEQSKIVENMRVSSNAVINQIQNVENEVNLAQSNLQNLVSNAEKKIEQLQSQHADEVSRKIKSLEQQSNEITNEFKNDCEQKKQDIKRFVNEANATLEKINGLHTSISGTEQKTQELFNQATSIKQEIANTQQEAQAVKTSIDQQLQNAQKQTQQIDSDFQQSNTNVAEIKAKNLNADEILATVKQKQGDIQEFYETIESYRENMTGIKKQADEDYANLKNESESSVGSFKEQTDAIVKENEGLQGQIKELLAEAVSAGLFGVFKQRQEFLAQGRNFWKWAVMASSLLVVAGMLLVAWLLSEKPDVIFFVRLGIMIPLGFLMYFAAAQYKKERQAEEEYAFKSAISFSLEPYRDLLVRMRDNDELEANFVEKLMEDIFDNPVKRMYKTFAKEDELAEGDIVSKMISSFGKLPKNKQQIIVETVKNIILGNSE